MVERFKREVEEHGTLLVSGFSALGSIVLGLVTYVYTHETDAIKESLKGFDTRVVRVEQTIAERGERFRALEDSSTHTSRDLDRISHEIETLNLKLDRILEQTMRPGARPNSPL